MPHAERIHLMQVIYSLCYGGSERLAFELARQFDFSRIRSSVCAVDFGGPLAEDLRKAGIPFHVLGRRPGFNWRLIPRLYRLFLQEQVDLVQTHHLNQLIYSGLGARLAGARLVHVEHEYFSLMHPKAKRHLRLMAPLCHQVVVVGEEIKAFLIHEVGLRPSKVTVIRNGVDVARYSPLACKSRAMLKLPPGGPLVGHVARLEAEKDQETLLQAFRIVLNDFPDARLVIVGDGSLRDRLKGRATSLGIAGCVEFLGLRRDVADLLPHLDVFVLSSINEGLPLAILEAMACSRPVVATAVGELPRLLDANITGLTVPHSDPGALAVSVTAILRRPEWGAAMGRAARQFIQEKFSLTYSVQQYHALYETIM
jgi:sugar transferase (PEP-CTERM/EpsH1 system associated)